MFEILGLKWSGAEILGLILALALWGMAIQILRMRAKLEQVSLLVELARMETQSVSRRVNVLRRRIFGKRCVQTPIDEGEIDPRDEEFLRFLGSM